jgi:nucleotide-binding universal stress UspA family protein
MDYKTILTHAGTDVDSHARAELAMRIAAMFDATVYGVAAVTWRPIVSGPEYGRGFANVAEDLRRESLDHLEAARVAFEKLAMISGRAFLWSSIEDYPSDAVVWAAQGADLVVADRSAQPELDGLTVSPADLVMASGLPVLLMSDELRTIHAERVVVAWKNTREARRAVSDALPFLRRAAETHLVHVSHEPELETAGRDLDEAAGRLIRHGLAVHTHALTEGRDVCEALEAFAKSKGADLIVLGAYGHSRLRELVFGGLTQRFFNRGAFHVLLSR